ncbi:kinase [Rheinheimera sp.]|jgi:D-glycerate 3-kinase|uniref:kinase n=1 Tax=Rheinheimera sp. TaxID=1869214 RepID=UPI0026271884|nr:kinase [Rheinheimera sp.]MCA1929161.1 kinase [Rheinheimera sp.]
MKTIGGLVIENTDNLWLRTWLLFSLKLHLSEHRPQSEHLAALAQLQPSTPLIIAISGAQGSGKTSLAAALQLLWAEHHVQSDVISLDDYYLEPAQRAERAHLWHPLFAERGVPGTHDTELLSSQLAGFRQGKAQAWRRYDKALDRAGTCSEPSSARLLIVEGWCLGLTAQTEQTLRPAINALELLQDPDASWRHKVNQQLACEYQQIWQQFDRLIWLNAPDWQAVCRWRAWQEHPLQQRGLGKTPAELEHFMLYFQRLTEESWRQLPDRADFILTLDQQHQLKKLTPDE